MSEVISHFKAVNGDEGFGEWEVDQVDVKLFCQHVLTSHLCLMAPSNVSFSVRGGGTFGGPQLFSFCT